MDGGASWADWRAVAKPRQEGGIAGEWVEGRETTAEGSCGGGLGNWTR
jgi:hypothetical protein